MDPVDEFAGLKAQIRQRTARMTQLRAAFLREGAQLRSGRSEVVIRHQQRRVFVKERLPAEILANPAYWETRVSPVVTTRALKVAGSRAAGQGGQGSSSPSTRLPARTGPRDETVRVPPRHAPAARQHPQMQPTQTLHTHMGAHRPETAAGSATAGPPSPGRAGAPQPESRAAPRVRIARDRADPALARRRVAWPSAHLAEPVSPLFSAGWREYAVATDDGFVLIE